MRVSAHHRSYTHLQIVPKPRTHQYKLGQKLTKGDESMCTMMSLTEYDSGSYNGDERNVNERVPEIVVAEMGRESFQRERGRRRSREKRRREKRIGDDEKNWRREQKQRNQHGDQEEHSLHTPQHLLRFFFLQYKTHLRFSISTSSGCGESRGFHVKVVRMRKLRSQNGANKKGVQQLREGYKWETEKLRWEGAGHLRCNVLTGLGDWAI